MRNNHIVQVLKTAIPYLDVAVGEAINIEGLLSDLRPFTRGRERRMLDMILQFFQMKRMMEMVQMIQTMQKFAAENTEAGTEHGGSEGDDAAGGMGNSSPMFDMLKAAVPPEQQGMFDMLSAMMAMPEDMPPEMPAGGISDDMPDNMPGDMPDAASVDAKEEDVLPGDEQKEGDNGSVVL